MNLALSDEQQFLKEAARAALSRVQTVEAARDALDGKELPDLWPLAREAGWPGLLVEEGKGGAGLGAFDAMLVLEECGRVLAAVPILSHLCATALLSAAGGDELLAQLASGERRAAYLPLVPPQDGASFSAEHGQEPLALKQAGDGYTLTGKAAFVPEAPGADLLVGGALLDGKPAVFAVESAASGVEVTPLRRYDATRPLAHLSFSEAKPVFVAAEGAAPLTDAWYLAQALLAAESVGAVERTLEVTVEYAKERYTFARPIGSYQAVKHQLVEVLRQLENSRSLLYYAGWAHESAPAEFPLAASSARALATPALEYGSRTMIAVHGGIGATWEHDAHLYFRRAQLSRLIYGGARQAARRVAGELFAGVRPT